MHINCKNKYELKDQMLKYFNFCFPFSMNDEVLHAGFDKLSHYILVVCCGKKNNIFWVLVIYKIYKVIYKIYKFKFKLILSGFF